MIKPLSFKKQLLAMGYRTTPADVSTCIEFIKSGKSRHWIHTIEKFLSQKTVERIYEDFHAGRLAFLENFHFDRLEKARKDPSRRNRYEIVIEAESMAPDRCWRLDHMRAIGIDDDDAYKLLDEYLYIRDIREAAEITQDFYDSKGNKTQPTTKALPHFNLLPRYLTILYQMYYRAEYPDASLHWAHRASYIRVQGQMKEDSLLIKVADDLMRYQVWEGKENLEACYRSIGRFKRTVRSRELFVEKIRKLIGKADKESDIWLKEGSTVTANFIGIKGIRLG